MNSTKKILYKEKLTDLINEEKLKENAKNDIDLLDEADIIMKENAEFLYPDIDFYSVVSGGIDSTLVSKYLSDLSDKKQNIFAYSFQKKIMLLQV